MINTQTQIDSLIDLAVIQRTELKQLIESLPQLRDHLSSEIERNLEEIEPAIRSELEQFVAARALDTQAKTSAELSAKLDAMARNLESTTAAKYSVLMAERAQNATLLAQAEARIAEAASALPGAVKGIVTDELSRFPRAGEIDQLRREFAEPRGLNPRGRWQVGETYNKLDLVSYNGDSYVSSTDGNREKPSRSTDAWTLSAARGNGGGGGGVTSLTDLVAVPANGELLIGNGSAFVNNTLTAGTGVTITNGPGSITIDATGAQELLTATVTNAESFAITRGQVVYLFGATGNRASVKLADNSNDAASSKTFGVVSEASISAGGNGLVTCVGVVTQLTLGTYTEGDVLYLGATPGAFTNVKPYAPNHLVYVGMVERANNGNGEVYVRIQNGFELDEIHDVQITTPPLAGALLMRDATNSLWKANRLTGTANQVTVTNADTAVTLSLPTAIANVNSVTAQSATNLTLAGGSTGASLVLLQGANGAVNIASNGTGSVNITPGASGSVNINSASGVGKLAVRTGTNENAHFRTATAIGGTGVGLDMLNDANGATVGFTLRASATRLTGGTISVTDTTAASSTTSGALQVGSNVGLSGNAGGASYFGGAVTATGNLVVSNGNLGVGGAVGSFLDILQGGNDAYVYNRRAGSLILGTNNATVLTFGTTGAATFAGTATLYTVGASSTGENSLIFTGADGNGNVRTPAKITGKQAGNGGYGSLVFQTAFNNSLVDALTINSSQAATFAGAVTLSAGALTATSTAATQGIFKGWNSRSGANADNGQIDVGGPTGLRLMSDASGTGGSVIDDRWDNAASSLTFRLRGNGTPVTSLTLNSTTATFAGAVTAVSSSVVSGSGGAARFGSVSGRVDIDPVDGRVALYGSGNAVDRYLDIIRSNGSTVGVQLRSNGTSTFLGPLAISDSTPSTNTTSGALVVTGGVGVGGAMNVGGAVTATGTLTVGAGASAFNIGNSGQLTIASNGAATDTPLVISNTVQNWQVRLNGSNSALWFFNATGGSVPLILSTTGAATFAGAVAIGNTVNTVSPTSPNRTVTMVIGGVTYYLAAKTTND